MEHRLQELIKESIFNHFYNLSQIPRGSGNEKAVSNYLVQFAKSLHLEVFQDESLNVIIKKPATKGHEQSKTIILQGHMDMVCVKNDDVEFDFERDPIPLIVEGDVIKTKGTTLGADNGIAISMAMAILESQLIEHPPLKVLFTVSEEVGMLGVKNLPENLVSGDILINLDAEEEGVILASCAGALRNTIHIPTVYKKMKEDQIAYEIILHGLLGGHSGMEIHKQRASAVQLIGRLLDVLDEKIGIDVTRIHAGEKLNAIPKQAKLIITIAKEKVETLASIIQEQQRIFHNEYQKTDPNIKIEFDQIPIPDKVMDNITKNKLILTLRLLPYGVQTTSANIEGLVVSSNNVGVIAINNNELQIKSAIRSSVGSLKYEIHNRMMHICQLSGTTLEIISCYPEWEFCVDSPIRQLMLKTYNSMYQKEALVQAIHAGLECGYLKEKIGDIDMVSIGPNIYDVHTPNERLSISSTRRTYKFLCEVLKQIL